MQVAFHKPIELILCDGLEQLCLGSLTGWFGCVMAEEGLQTWVCLFEVEKLAFPNLHDIAPQVFKVGPMFIGLILEILWAKAALGVVMLFPCGCGIQVTSVVMPITPVELKRKKKERILLADISRLVIRQSSTDTT